MTAKALTRSRILAAGFLMPRLARGDVLQPPDAMEAKAGQALVRRHGLPSLGLALFNSNEFLFIP